jgi:hypothetical protein
VLWFWQVPSLPHLSDRILCHSPLSQRHWALVALERSGTLLFQGLCTRCTLDRAISPFPFIRLGFALTVFSRFLPKYCPILEVVLLPVTPASASLALSISALFFWGWGQCVGLNSEPCAC